MCSPWPACRAGWPGDLRPGHSLLVKCTAPACGILACLPCSVLPLQSPPGRLRGARFTGTTLLAMPSMDPHDSCSGPPQFVWSAHGNRPSATLHPLMHPPPLCIWRCRSNLMRGDGGVFGVSLQCFCRLHCSSIRACTRHPAMRCQLHPGHQTPKIKGRAGSAYRGPCGGRFQTSAIYAS
ncbi:hypothetical protein EJ06DRAFT_433211 [Trichodelitschia bisporula]|uniref:Uncharacterized protein n=1 Tax=Trichodelitschia bisporula TaxID=703511 RepID=A0A6G1HWS8_9PEZI|nr:hypothetical protein EJ06DRAFT_433211 [Trichodelitschia bisporula]